MKTANQAAAEWGISSHEVIRLCRLGRIRGAYQEIIRGRVTWLIPAEASKPEPGQDGRPPYRTKSKEPSK